MDSEWRRLKELFLAALDLPADERAAFLATHCADDAALQREVVSLLAQHDAEDDFLERPVVGSPDVKSAAGAGMVAGHRLGPYRTIRELGHGGMGTVYLAVRADDAYRKRVAIKVVRRGMDTDEILRRFKRERDALAALDHPNIARIVDGGTTEDGLPYFVMDYVDGVTLDEYCDAARATVETRLALFRHVCDAVHYAHQNLIVHRDLKPDNILVTPDGVPKLLDFGIAKMLAEPTAEDRDVTVAVERRMTLSHASPEQVRGAAVTTASDVYSLGVLLYALLCGRRPYATSGVATDDVLRAICDDDPLPPSARVRAAAGPDDAAVSAEHVAAVRGVTVVALQRRLRDDLDRIVAMAMRKDPQRRYASVAQFSEDIRRHLAGLPVIAQRDTLTYRARKFVARHRVGVAAAVLVGTSLLTGLAGTLWQATVAADERDRARLESLKAERTRTFLENMLASADPTNAGRTVTVAQVLDEAARRVPRELEGQPEVRAAIEATIGKTYLGLGLHEAGETHLREAVRLYEALGGGRDTLDLARALGALAAGLLEKGNLAEAEPVSRRALAMSQTVFGPDDVETARALNGLGSVLLATGAYPEAESVHRQALAIQRQRLGETHAEIAITLNDLAVVLGTQARFAEAEPLHREAVRVTKAVHGDEHPDVASATGALAYVLESLDRQSEALALYEQVIAMRRKLLGDEHPLTNWVKYSYGSLLQARGENVRAEAISREILAFRGRTLNDSHPIVAASLQVLGLALDDEGRSREALPLLRESLALRERTLPASHWLVGSSESVLGRCLMRLGRYQDAEPLVVHGYETIRAAFGDGHLRTRDALERVAQLYDAWGRHDVAVTYRSRLAASAPGS